MADRTILHSDINCCYASIELLHHPELRGKPVAVGGSYLSTAYYNSISDNFGYRNRLDDISLDDPEARQGIVLTADYIAKKCGVKTGMPLWEAKRVCPEITFIPPHMDLYLRFSRMAHEIYAEYTDLQEPYGIDESWLDVTASATLKGDGEQIAKEISNRMKSELGITVSIGVSFNKIFAKLGSDYKKPDAITTMYRHEYREKAWVLPASDLLFVGRSTEKRLAKIGIYMIGDIARADEKTLHYALGKHGDMLWAYANGLDESPVKYENTHAPIKSIGNSTTTHRELVNDDDVKVIVYVMNQSRQGFGRMGSNVTWWRFRFETVHSLHIPDRGNLTVQHISHRKSPRWRTGCSRRVIDGKNRFVVLESVVQIWLQMVSVSSLVCS